ncbi:helix-turn-helix domain-containing protein [Tsukamurella strandjordii]|uniref:Helix-turn-helix domain-containing protein n=1 Tax=Tsukamurella strandjordii TaxID=147577 RepID=A0AA90SM27_9ACTN|nr:helix-turn-helix domain-containing protein [Tsukamurella strandjordii]MDP0398753.1 helix-turn-helix domain-containing protein [Tsukamurella strandjordii]
MSRMNPVEATAPADPTLPTLTRDDVAVRCANQGIPGITPRYVKAETLRGRLACHRIGNRVLYAVADVEAWLRSKRQGSTQTGALSKLPGAQVGGDAA